MNRLRRNALIVVVCCACLAGVVIACPAWAADVGLDFWNFAEYEDALAEDQQLAHQIETESQTVQRSILLRDALIEDLIADRTTLSAVFAQYLELNRSSPDRLRTLRLIFPADSDEDSTFLQIRAFVRVVLAEEPARRDSLLARLQRDFETLRADND